MQNVKRLIVASMIIFGSPQDSFARIMSLPAQKIELQTSNSVLHGYRYVKLNGEPNDGPAVLLTHGLNLNLHEFGSLVPVLVDAGFDVYAFNFRGHGNGSEKSSVIRYKEGDYGFDPIVSEDFPAMVRHVSDNKRRKILVVGHSMGGMVPRAALSRGTVNAKTIRSLVLIGSPARFTKNTLSSVGPLVDLYLNSGFGYEGFEWFALKTSIEKLVAMIPGYNFVMSILDSIGSSVSRGIAIQQNFFC